MIKRPLQEYEYTLPKENIRKEPLKERDASRLFVYDTRTDTITFDYFYNLAKYVPPNACMVMNATGVIPARVTFRKDTGGKVGGLILLNEGFDHEMALPAIVDEKIFPGRKLSLLGTYWFTITRQDEQRFYLKPEFDSSLVPSLLEQCGTTPTPFYLGAMSLPEEELRLRYQTIFAQEKKSVAAPTASLHFTERVFDSLAAKNIYRVEIVLDVGLGTFAEVEERHVETKKLHSEKFYISSSSRLALQKSVTSYTPIIAVGTTVVRTIESCAEQLLQEGEEALSGATNLFIMPPYTFKLVDHLITNFHVPKSSLMALVDAFLEYKGAKRRIIELYTIAQEEGFMFYSFGDSMIIL